MPKKISDEKLIETMLLYTLDTEVIKKVLSVLGYEAELKEEKIFFSFS